MVSFDAKKSPEQVMNAALQQIFKKTIEEKVDEWFPLPKGDEALPELTDNILNKCIKLLVILSFKGNQVSPQALKTMLT